MERRGAAAAPSLELPGFRFHPTEEELLEFYLKHHVTRNNKQQQLRAPFDIIPTVHLYRHDPWDLPGLAAIASEREWRLPQLETAKGGAGLEWMQDPFLTQLRSPWMEGLCLSPYYASVLNF
ncbi:Putative NAC domain-containing protein 94 [Triticum urartu]|uniref:NAC domain-containing protein n=2 Tax=Triticum TaxID=4564 RepID=A0A9R0ZPG5_TRITD|nr:Putative NAC domain-containing protein 94 [Triticum urartu]VAI81694.1 unnamed protein product [Triticum turgidum subsp. durum]